MRFIIAISLLFFLAYFVNCKDFEMDYPCTNIDDCKKKFSPNSICRDGKCLCGDSRENLKSCQLPRTSLRESKNLGGVVGRVCKYDKECYSDNIWCNTTTSQCQCKPNYVGDSSNSRCLPIVNHIGGNCQDNKQCLVNMPNTTCVNDQCVCITGFHHINGKCWKSVGFGEYCTVNQECSHVEYAQCNETNQCECSKISVLTKDGKGCLPKAQAIMGECKESEQCSKAFDEADCIDNRCQCWNKSHFVLSIGKCISNKELGEACTEDYECYQGILSEDVKNLKCIDRICACAENFTNVEGKCVATDKNSRFMKNHSVLVFLVLCLVTASCSTISVAFRHHVYPCLNRRLHTQTMKSCTYDVDCIENAYCFNQETCMCMDGYVVNKNRTHMQCLKIVTNLGDPCDENIQCEMTFTSQAECRGNICVCSDGSHYEAEQRRCYESVGLGKICQTNYNCYVEGSKSFCSDGFCSCPLLHHSNADGTKCLQSANLGQNCTNDEECITLNSRCSGVCSCKIDYALSNDKKRCLKAAMKLGDFCEEDSQCSLFLKNTKCGEENKCICVLDLKPRETECVRKLNPEMIGKPCYSRSQCVLPTSDTELKPHEVANIDCINNICSCAQDYILTENKLDCIRFSENSSGKLIITSLLPYLIIIKIF
ncbi:prion-like-(Q/N-rich) domain-bearing protein 25 [Chelonus insularis]|uniref:prion-like-(Q/N-rich) domain-bearing protein 25 n=1 Tax=Chelonus insularis TaxID=460826 RepID=UPI00158A0EE9|nr:prion-like-(Q/N-rich) domain-bearing protein 25 [Chelonus insularis]